MKNIFLLIAFFMTCGGAFAQSQLKGHLNDLRANDSIIVFTKTAKDTVDATGGKFCYEFKGTIPEVIRIFNYPKQLANGKMEAFRMRPIQVLMFPGESVDVSGTFDNYHITGNAFYDIYNKVRARVNKEDSIRMSINAEYMSLMQAKAPREQILAKFEELKKADANLHVRLEEYIKDNLDSEVSLYLLYTNRMRSGEEIMDKFSDNVKNGRLGYMHSELVDHYEYMAARREAAKIIKEGKMAPDFLLKDINGKDFALSSLRGKYVVLDFWGSWCGWCIKGFPEMKKMYEKYSDRLEIVGVDCRDSEDKWKTAVMENGLKWTNVINSTDKTKDLTHRYNIAGFPTKIIISPEGKIVKIVVGEKPEFYETIDALMK